MTRNLVFRILLAFVLAGGLFGSVTPVLSQAAPLAVAISQVSASNIRDITFTVSWITDQMANGEVHYGVDPANLAQTAYDQRGSATSDDVHYIVLTGLLPNTIYHFDVVSGATVDDNGGGHYVIHTGLTLSLPSSDSVYGRVFQPDGATPARGCIVLITLHDANGVGSSGDAALLSSLTDNNGYWYTNLANARTLALDGYFNYSPSGDQLRLDARCATDEQVEQTIDTSNDYPAPSMVIIKAPTAVTMGLIEAQPASGWVNVKWETFLELDMLGFNIYRASGLDGEKVRINPVLIPAQAIGDFGGSLYTFIDTSVKSGQTYYYWVEAIDLYGSTYHGPVSTQSLYTTYISIIAK